MRALLCLTLLAASVFCLSGASDNQTPPETTHFGAAVARVLDDSNKSSEEDFLDDFIQVEHDKPPVEHDEPPAWQIELKTDMFIAIGQALKTCDFSVSDEELGKFVVELVETEKQKYNERVNEKELNDFNKEWHTVETEGRLITPSHTSQHTMLLYNIVSQTIARNFNSAVKSEQVQEVAQEAQKKAVQSIKSLLTASAQTAAQVSTDSLSALVKIIAESLRSPNVNVAEQSGQVVESAKQQLNNELTEKASDTTQIIVHLAFDILKAVATQLIEGATPKLEEKTALVATSERK